MPRQGIETIKSLLTSPTVGMLYPEHNLELLRLRWLIVGETPGLNWQPDALPATTNRFAWHLQAWR